MEKEVADTMHHKIFKNKQESYRLSIQVLNLVRKTYEPILEEIKPQAITGNPKSIRHKPHPINSNPTIASIAPKFHVSKDNRILS